MKEFVISEAKAETAVLVGLITKGQDEAKTKEYLDELEFLSRREGGQGAAWHVGTRGSGNGGTGGYGASDAYEDDDIPF